MLESSKILVIDDDPAIRETINTYLNDSSYRLLQAVDGRSGLALCHEQTPALVLCDLLLPDTDGLQVLDTVAQEFPETPVIILSATGELNDAVSALQHGAWDYLTTPIENKAVLKHAIRQGLERAELLRKNREYQDNLEATNRQLQQSLQQLREDEEAGRRLQFQLLPPQHQEYGNYEFSRLFFPSLYLSGDFVDYFYIDDEHLGFYMADVSGHGASSAFVTVLLRSYMNRYLELYRQHKNDGILNPAKILARANLNLLSSDLDKYLTMFYGILDKSSNQLCYSNGGQFPYPILFDGNNAKYIECKSKPIGLFDFADYQTETLELPENFVMALFSDGILETLPQATLSEKQAYLLSLLEDPAVDTQSLTQTLSLTSMQTPPDDITVLLLRKTTKSL